MAVVFFGVAAESDSLDSGGSLLGFWPGELEG
jgi:hypothetical protein